MILGRGARNNRRSLSVSLTAAGIRIFRRFNCEDRLGVRIYRAASRGLRRIGLGAHRLPVLRQHNHLVVMSGILLLQLVSYLKSHLPPNVSAWHHNRTLFIKVSFW
jgi:hypothetical protein